MDLKAAYLVALEFLPRKALWLHAIGVRRDGCNAANVFKVLDAVRCEFLARIGDLGAGHEVPVEWSGAVTIASTQDVAVAYQLVVGSLPQLGLWRVAISNRNDGSSPDGVLAALDAIRRMFQIAIGNLFEMTDESLLIKGQG
ncbi:MAG: hypothetical protein ACREPQ_14835 [Rhodanobacter sp.]